MSCPKVVSIIVNNYNYGRFLKEAVDSALSQRYSNTEVIVVDDGSTDNSREIIAGYGGQIIPIIKENGGQASAFNAGLSASSGDVICFLDADDKLLPTAAERALPYFSDPEVVKVHWPLYVIDERGTLTGEVIHNGPLPEGDFRDDIIRNGPDSYLSMPTSGNAWSRRVLERILPIPEQEYREGADGFLLTFTPLFGSIRSVAQPQGCYRVHGSNQYWSHTMDERISRSLSRYERRAKSLDRFLQILGIHANVEDWKARNPYHQWMTKIDRSARELKALIKPCERFLLVDDNEWGNQFLTGRQNIPFLERGGQYWGPPADDPTAIRELERLRRAGAGLIVFGWPSFWWLDHYAGLREHLRSNYPCLLSNDRLLVFDLRVQQGFGNQLSEAGNEMA